MLTHLAELIADPASIWTLFYNALLVLLLTKGLSLAYYRGLFGQALPLAQTQKDLSLDEWIIWLTGLLGVLGSLVPMLFPSAPLTAAGLVAGLLGVAFFVVALWLTVLWLAYHDLPRWLAHVVLAVMIAATLLVTLILFLLGVLTPVPGDEFVYALAGFLYVAFFAAIFGLIVVLAYKIGRALGNWLDKTWVGTVWRKIQGKPQTATGGGQTAAGAGVTNPSGVVSGGVTVLPPDTCITVDFGASTIEDHWGVADLRLSVTPAPASVSVQVSNDGSSWENCANEGGQDYDVPWWNSPWRYVKICNLGATPIQLTDVQDLSR